MDYYVNALKPYTDDKGSISLANVSNVLVALNASHLALEI